MLPFFVAEELIAERLLLLAPAGCMHQSGRAPAYLSAAAFFFAKIPPHMQTGRRINAMRYQVPGTYDLVLTVGRGATSYVPPLR